MALVTTRRLQCDMKSCATALELEGLDAQMPEGWVCVGISRRNRETRYWHVCPTCRFSWFDELEDSSLQDTDMPA